MFSKSQEGSRLSDQELDGIETEIAEAVTQDEKLKAYQKKRETILNRMAKGRIEEYVSRFDDPLQDSMLI